MLMPQGGIWTALNDFNGHFAARLWSVWKINLWLCKVCVSDVL